MKLEPSHRRRLSTESLEPRELLAGDVSVSVVRGTLYITGDNAANYVLVSGTGTPGQFTVTGLNDASSSPTKINHVANGTTTVGGVTGSVIASLKGGNDFFGFTDGTVRGDLSIDMGAGCDQTGVGIFTIPGSVTTFVSGPSVTPLQLPANPTSVTICGSLCVNLGSGDNELLESSLLVKGCETIVGCEGNDSVDLEDSTPEHGETSLGTGVTILKDLSINLGAGRNSIEAYDLEVCGSMCVTASGTNFVELAVIDVHCNVTINLCGPCSQIVTIEPEPEWGTVVGVQNHIGGNLSISTGSGGDTVEQSSLEVGGCDTVRTDGGNDEVLLGDAHDMVNPVISPSIANIFGLMVGKDLNVDLGTGQDELDAIDVVVCGNFNITQGNGDLTAELEDLIVKCLLKLTSGNGCDRVSLESSTAKNATISLGSGDDCLEVAQTTVTQTACFDGGPGCDTYVDGGNQFGTLKRTNFEKFVTIV